MNDMNHKIQQNKIHNTTHGTAAGGRVTLHCKLWAQNLRLFYVEPASYDKLNDCDGLSRCIIV